MEDNWLLHNLLMVQDKCKFTSQEMAQLQRNTISVC
jgi:adenosine deaminase